MTTYMKEIYYTSKTEIIFFLYIPSLREDRLL